MNISSGSDLLFKVSFSDAIGNPQPIPNYDFKLEYKTHVIGSTVITGRTPSSKILVASQIGGVLSNCEPEIGGGILTVFFDNPGLSKGRLECKTTFYKPNAIFTDGTETVVIDVLTDIYIYD